jgi:hypothetical protein
LVPCRVDGLRHVEASHFESSVRGFQRCWCPLRTTHIVAGTTTSTVEVLHVLQQPM